VRPSKLGTILIALLSGLAVSLVPLAAGPVTSAAAAGATTSAVAYQEDAAHDGHVDDPTFFGPLNKLWSVNLSGPAWYPLIVGDQVFVDFANSGYGTQVEALSLDSGSVDWGPVNIGGTYSFGALAYDQGRVFALNFNGMLYAFDAATGVQDWSIQLPNQWSFTSPPTAYNGVVYVIQRRCLCGGCRFGRNGVRDQREQRYRGLDSIGCRRRPQRSGG
jgi:hypothetical protein